jgi:hypothetical protein
VDTAREHQSLNITSAHKASIIIVSIGDLVAEIIRVGGIDPDSEQLLLELLAHADLSKNDLEYYKTSFMTDLSKDFLFLECRNLFGIAD